MKSHRVHVHDMRDSGRWIASADFRRRPASSEIAAAFPVLREPGRYEVVVNVIRDGDEIAGWAWLQDAAPERVIFRRFLDHKDTDLGDGIIALFPDLPDGRPGMVQSYMHIGQHSAASMNLIGGEPRTTRPARPEEYAALRAELEAQPRGYKLAVIQRTPKATNQPYNIQARASDPDPDGWLQAGYDTARQHHGGSYADYLIRHDQELRAKGHTPRPWPLSLQGNDGD